MRKLVTALARQAAEEIREDMNDLTNETIDAAKGANLPPEARAQLEAARDQPTPRSSKGKAPLPKGVLHTLNMPIYGC